MILILVRAHGGRCPQFMVLQAKLVRKARRVRQVHRAHKVRKVTQELRELQGHRVRRV